MRNNTHAKFILTPILCILKEGIIACRGIGIGIETQALSEYVMQTIFLKMTGALEQKMKCICWEIASNDYEYRCQYLKKNYGECSSYDDKNHVYKDLIEAILKINKNFNYETLFADCDINTYIVEIIKQKITSAITIQADKKGRNLTNDEIDKLRLSATASLSERKDVIAIFQPKSQGVSRLKAAFFQFAQFQAGTLYLQALQCRQFYAYPV